jgi:hypothetical protein
MPINDDPKAPFDEPKREWQIMTHSMHVGMHDWVLLQRLEIPDVLWIRLWDCRNGQWIITGASLIDNHKDQIYMGPMGKAQAMIAYDDVVTRIAARIIQK